MYYILIYFIQYWSRHKPLWLCVVFSPFMAHLGELTQSGEVDISGYKITHMIQNFNYRGVYHFTEPNEGTVWLLMWSGSEPFSLIYRLLAHYMREIGSLPDYIQN